jgi:hypothetical protein
MRLILGVVLVATMTLGHVTPCRAAGLVIEAPNLTAAPGSTGSFDVLLVNTNAIGGTSYDVAADSLELSLVGPLSVTFTGVSIDTVAAPYIYVTSATTVPGGLPLSLDPFPNTHFTASDSEVAAPGFRTVTPGETFGLAHVSYAVSPPSPGGTDTIAFGSPATSLSDINGFAVPFTISNGSISVAVVPEPATLTMDATAAIVGLGVFWWCRRRRGVVGC